MMNYDKFIMKKVEKKLEIFRTFRRDGRKKTKRTFISKLYFINFMSYSLIKSYVIYFMPYSLIKSYVIYFMSYSLNLKCHIHHIY